MQAKLSGFILLTSAILVFLSAISLIDALANSRKSDRIAEISQCSEQLFATIEALSFERGRTNVVLSAETVISESNKNFIDVRRRQVDGYLTAGMNQLSSIDQKLADDLQQDYEKHLKLRSKADTESFQVLSKRDAAFREEWFRQSTKFIFNIKNALEILGKKERGLGLFDFYHHFQLDCVEFRLFSGYSASVLSAAINKTGSMNPAETLDFLESRSKADYLWSCIESDVLDFRNADLLEKKDRVFHEYYRVYRPFQDVILAQTLAGPVTKADGEHLVALSVPAFDSIFELIRAVNIDARKNVAAMKNNAATQFRIALFEFFLILVFVVFTLIYFKVMLFAPLNRIVTALKCTVTGHSFYELEKDEKRDDEIGLLTQGVKMLQISMQEERRLRELNETLAITDRLTGLFNRQLLEQKIDQAMAQADRYAEPLSIILFDLDHFKKVNDTYGHPIGDEVLKQTAQTVMNIIRSADLFVRFGGEEFLILMPQTNADGATIAAEKARVAIENACHPLAGQVTASFGVAEKKRAEAFADWYQRADEALYLAKNSGRNRVVCFRPDAAPVASVHMGWRPEWECGNPEIDAQHRKLLETAGKYFDIALLPHPEPEKTLSLLSRLFEEITYHFSCEEQILLRIGYPGAEEHAAIHRRLLDKAARLKEEYLVGQLKSSPFFSFILDDVVLGHMLQEDQLFFPYIRKDTGPQSD